MDRNTLSIVALSVTATVLGFASMVTPSSATAEAVVSGRDYQAVTTRMQTGGDALYILDNKTGQLAVFTYSPKDNSILPRDIRPLSAAFKGR